MNKLSRTTTAIVLTVGLVGAGAAFAGKRFHQSKHEHADYAVTYIAGKLDLDPTQEQALEALKDQLVYSKNLMHEQMESTETEIMQLVTADTFDQAKALEMINKKTSTIDELAPELVTSLGNFMDSLDGEQKQEIVEFAERMHDKRHRRGH